MGIVKIDSFQGPHRYLSNFYVEPDGTHVEGEFQRAKAAMFQDRLRFEGLSPTQAKKLGRQVELRPDWEAVKVDIMWFYVTKKFKDHPTLAAKLKATGKMWLEEGNWWGDTFWGVSGGSGENMLGHILMDVRSSLR